MLNATDFLDKGVYVSSEDKRKSGAVRGSSAFFTRVDPKTGRAMKYKVMDNPVTLKDEDWAQVVAVFVSGQAWQFKGWKWSNPVDVFKHAMGIYLTFDGRTIDPTVQSWNCKTIKVYISIIDFN